MKTIRIILCGIVAYVSLHNLPVKVYKDYGWPAVTIPVK